MHTDAQRVCRKTPWGVEAIIFRWCLAPSRACDRSIRGHSTRSDFFESFPNFSFGGFPTDSTTKLSRRATTPPKNALLSAVGSCALLGADSDGATQDYFESNPKFPSLCTLPPPKTEAKHTDDPCPEEHYSAGFGDGGSVTERKIDLKDCWASAALGIHQLKREVA